MNSSVISTFTGEGGHVYIVEARRAGRHAQEKRHKPICQRRRALSAMNCIP